MALSWNEIRSRALFFQKEWADKVAELKQSGRNFERSETQTFYNEFFNVFGISRRRVASFEEPVKKLSGGQGFIDLFWKGVLLVEQKSTGRDLTRAKTQAFDYFPGLKENELPRYVLASDFMEFCLIDLDTGAEHKFKLSELDKNIELFGFIAGYEKREFKDQEPVNIKASELMGKLYDTMRDSGYGDHNLQLFLVRILFCLFSDDTGIFERDGFKFFIEEKTNIDGSDTGLWLSQLFQTLNTPMEKRQKTLDETLASFPYINGHLFSGMTEIPSFDSKMRSALLECCYFDWSAISPAIFGSLFQSVSDKDKRRSLGEHYTSEKNIMKTIGPLFLDDLYAEFEQLKKLRGTNKKNKLFEFQNKLAKLKFFDPACGCGNFLILAYREIRKLEIEILKEIYQSGEQSLDVSQWSQVDVDNFYGIEIEEFPAKIAEVALWLMDHKMNMALSTEFGMSYVRIPLKKSAHIINNNALRINWADVVKPNELSYILGNPPFIGARMKSEQQSAEMQDIMGKIKGWGNLDYVCAWYVKAAEFIKNTKIKVAFVSTSSISQGTQVGVLWNTMLNKYKIKIHFAHRTFVWDNEASGKAHVHCVIIGFANYDTDNKRIFDYDNPRGEAHETKAKNINPYLVDADDLIILARKNSISKVPEMLFGSMPNDGGNFLFTESEYLEFIKTEPQSKQFFRSFISGREFLNGGNRYCLWLKDANPSELKLCPMVMERIKNIKELRLKSARKETKELANYPTLFGEIRQPDSDYILVPRVSSERRLYIPMGFMSKDDIVADSCLSVPGATLYNFGILTSAMHMTWMRFVCGRLKSDYRYSKDIVYNNFPWPENPSSALVNKIEKLAQNILDIRGKYPDSTLADLYDPNTMPADLVRAHNSIDKAVDLLYSKTQFKNDTDRITFLFNLYESTTQPLKK